MAKVKDQIRDRSTVSYVDAAGRTCYLDELFRHIMPDAYPLPSLNPTGVARKSARGYNAPTQGDGSPEQLPWRMCFQECTDRWNALPKKCPAVPLCKGGSSKKNVWDAKQAQGVMCSYFDLYMSCCMKSCTRITITGHTGASIAGGSIGSTEGCWPCESPCETSTLSIGYTTGQMMVGESQALWAHDSFYGDSVPCCAAEDLEWEIVSGGGELSSGRGEVVVYTAPDSNPNCEANASIVLTDCCERAATLSIAIFGSAVAGEIAGWTNFQEHRSRDFFNVCRCGVVGYKFNCNGDVEQVVYGGMGDGGEAPCTVAEMDTVLGALCAVAWADAGPDPRDVRTPELLAAGCCPPQFF